MADHKIIRVWCRGAAHGDNYAYRCTCGRMVDGIVSETYAREAGAEHMAEAAEGVTEFVA